ncbi:MAG TPA: 2-oxoacid:acceptor oxidoreductase subunit alpha [Candidatus Poseidoniales archaeon]|nr:2-oxoacid:acceptor oxidoreductase subunit alpha [Candidatus Poseidoniales archaeon]
MTTRVNDFQFRIATANGTGSQSANLILLRSLFEMGVHVSGKNMFPSNISGLPTWYLVRVSEQGYQAPADDTHVHVLMNKATWMEDLEEAETGSVVIFNTDVKLPVERDDVIQIPIPMTTMARTINAKLARMLANVIYVGAIAELIGIDAIALGNAINLQFKGKSSAIDLNKQAAELGREWIRENHTEDVELAIETRPIDEDIFMMEGNEAVALGSLFGGMSFLSWYPITPSSSIAESIIEHAPRLRSTDDGETVAVIQAEDELAAIGMVIGAGWAGARAMTATSGPGISLMSEFIGLAYFAEVPSVIWNVARVGPSTGLPTRTQQADLSLVYEASHGDTQHLVLIPGDISECFEFAWRALEYAETYQTVVFGLSDLDLGMNRWLARDLPYPEKPLSRGKVIRSQEELDAVQNYGRYRDVDGDGIPYRTLPGSGLEPILSRGTGRDEDGAYSEQPDVYRANMERLKRKIDGARDALPAPILREEKELEVGIIFFGSLESTIQEIDDIIEETGRMVSQCRVRALPLHSEVEAFVERHERVIVLELNRDGQLYTILRKELPIHLVPRVHSVAYSDGFPPRAHLYAEAVLAELKKWEEMEVSA